MSDLLFSVVSPIYKGEKMIPELVRRIKQNLSQITESFEIILVNDSSPDDSWKMIVNECKTDDRVKGLNLSRNFGQHYAITAGLSYAKGEWVVVMDCDLQDRPEEIPNLYRKANEGYDIVLAQRLERQDSFIKKLSSTLFYMVFSYLTDTRQDKTVANFGIYSKNAIHALLSMHDAVRYFPTMIQWIGYRKVCLPVVHAEREEGKSSYTFPALFKLAFNNILAFSDKPLRLTVKLGFAMSLFALLLTLFYLSRYFLGDILISGFTTLILSLWFIAGIFISLLGILGLYVGRIFQQVKGRPYYIISNSRNLDI